MSKIFDLINELCSNGVEFRELGEIAEVSAGNSAPQEKKLFQNGIYPFCRTSDVGKVHNSIDFHQIQDKLNNDGIRGLRLFRKETILLPKSGASTLLNHRVMLSVDSYVSSHLATIYRKENLVMARFLFYLLSKFDINQMIPDKSYPSLKVSDIAKVKLPVPPMEVQREIVHILDSFTLLTAELTARKKQYEFYRDFLLSFDELDKNGGGCELKCLEKFVSWYVAMGCKKGLCRKWSSCDTLWSNLYVLWNIC